MEELTAQTRLLCGNHIESKEQLLDFQNGLNQEISTLLDSRKSLYHRLRRLFPFALERDRSFSLLYLN
jgi:hypothetical protein